MSGVVVRGRTPTFPCLLDYAISNIRRHVESTGALEPENDEGMDAAYLRYIEARHNGAVDVIRDVFSRFAPRGLLSWVLHFLSSHPPNYTAPPTNVADE